MNTQPNIVIKIKTTHLKNTPAIENYIRKKIGLFKKFLTHFAHESKELVFDIEVGKTTAHHKHGEVFRAEINFTVGSTVFRAEATEENLYAAIDKAKDEMQMELRRHKNKHNSLLKKSGAEIKKRMRE